MAQNVNTDLLLNDKAFAEAMLEKDEITYADEDFILRNLLKMEYYTVAIKFFFDQAELDEYKENTTYKVALKPYTFCHFSAASRQNGSVLFGSKDKMGCTNASFNFNWKGYDEAEIKSHMKYVRDREQAEKFIKTKPRLPEGLLGFATAPLHKATFKPDIIHIICNVLQSYHIANDYASANDIHPVQSNIMMNSSVCGGVTGAYVRDAINIIPACSSSYTAGKTEQGEINVYCPYDKFNKTVQRLLERTAQYGGASFPRTGETFPGFNICKLCDFIAFIKPKDK